MTSEKSLWRPAAAFVGHPLGVAVILVLLLLFVHMPGYMSPDSVGIYIYADKLDQIIFYHPPIMMWFFAIGKNLTPESQFGVLVTQTAFFIFSLLYAASSVTSSWRRINFFVIGFALFPPVFLTVGTLWKSVWALSFLLIVIGVAARYLRTKKRIYLLHFALAALVAGLSRHDMAAPIGLIMFFLVWSISEKYFDSADLKSNAIRFLASGFASFALFIPYYLTLTAINDSLSASSQYPSSVAMMHDIISISIEKDEILLPEFVTGLNPPLSTAKLKEGFSPRTCNTMLKLMNNRSDDKPYNLPRPKTDAEARQISAAWLSAITQHPDAFLKSRWGVAKSLWGFERNVYLPFYHFVKENVPNTKNADRSINVLVNQYGRYVSRNIKILYEQWAYFLLGCILFVGFAFLTSGPKRLIGLMATSCGLVHFIIMSAAACSGDFRYSLLLVSASLFGLFAALATD